MLWCFFVVRLIQIKYILQCLLPAAMNNYAWLKQPSRRILSTNQMFMSIYPVRVTRFRHSFKNSIQNANQNTKTFGVANQFSIMTIYFQLYWRCCHEVWQVSLLCFVFFSPLNRLSFLQCVSIDASQQTLNRRQTRAREF